MGMYDSVVHVCDCGHTVEWQSKDGPRELDTYPTGAVPFRVAEDVLGRTERCEGCDSVWTLERAYPPPINTVPLWARKGPS